jgi:hypothetical protein
MAAEEASGPGASEPPPLLLLPPELATQLSQRGSVQVELVLQPQHSTLALSR